PARRHRAFRKSPGAILSQGVAGDGRGPVEPGNARPPSLAKSRQGLLESHSARAETPAAAGARQRGRSRPPRRGPRPRSRLRGPRRAAGALARSRSRTDAAPVADRPRAPAPGGGGLPSRRHPLPAQAEEAGPPARGDIGEPSRHWGSREVTTIDVGRSPCRRARPTIAGDLAALTPQGNMAAVSW